MKFCKNHDSDTFLSLYKTFILPKLKYSNLIFTLNNSNVEKIEKVQTNITKFISYKMGKNDSNYIERLKNLKLLLLSVRRDLKILKLINSVITNINIPQNWLNLFTFKRSQRNGNFLYALKTRINLCDRNVFSYAIKLYNSLPLNLRNNDNLLIDINVSEKFLYNSFIQKYFLEN